MSLKDQIAQDLKTAMKAKDQGALRALRAIKSAILLAETAEGRDGAPLTEDEELKLLMKQAKQRKESVDQYTSSQRDDLAKIEAEELAVIEKYLPQQMDTEELARQVKAIIAETGASSMKDMGKVMGIASKRFAGQADGKAISQVVKQILNS